MRDLNEGALSEMLNKISAAGIRNLVKVAAPVSLSDVLSPMELVENVDYCQDGSRLRLISHKAESMVVEIRNAVGIDA